MGVWQKEINTALLLVLATAVVGWNNGAISAITVIADAGHCYAASYSDQPI